MAVLAPATSIPRPFEQASAIKPAEVHDPPPRPAAAPLTRETIASPVDKIRWRHSRALGLPWRGRLVAGVRVPAAGARFFTWDPVQRRSPNRAWRRVGSDRLVRTLMRVLDEFAAAHPRAPRIGIGDLSRPGGGDFGVRYGLPGHASHQNGLDADLYYPRLDRWERPPRAVAQIDRTLAQDLVDRFVRAGARYVFVGPSTGLTGPPAVVQPLAHHDNHLHVRLR
ncbi:MAG: penicillin-insensitive murein endopeptidase [Gaiellaceae bacterium MAG52_C11]|nr:penicillin-insensitive murein endopeptidase [Candidatus Gaiellasilicea maunaloa]